MKNVEPNGRLLLCVLVMLQSCFCLFYAFPLFCQIVVNKSVLNFRVSADNRIFDFL